MTIRILTLGAFALLCFAAGGMSVSRLSFAADAGTTQFESAHGPAATQAGPTKGGHSGERRQQLKDELMKLPPEQRKAKIEELKQQVAAEKAQKLQQRKDEFQGKWDKASPEDRARFCASVKQKCAEDGKKFACTIAQDKCAAGH